MGTRLDVGNRPFHITNDLVRSVLVEISGAALVAFDERRLCIPEARARRGGGDRGLHGRW
jgi:hypothetical protein